MNEVIKDYVRQKHCEKFWKCFNQRNKNIFKFGFFCLLTIGFKMNVHSIIKEPFSVKSDIQQVSAGVLCLSPL